MTGHTLLPSSQTTLFKSLTLRNEMYMLITYQGQQAKDGKMHHKQETIQQNDKAITIKTGQIKGL